MFLGMGTGYWLHKDRNPWPFCASIQSVASRDVIRILWIGVKKLGSICFTCEYLMIRYCTYPTNENQHHRVDYWLRCIWMLPHYKLQQLQLSCINLPPTDFDLTGVAAVAPQHRSTSTGRTAGAAVATGGSGAAGATDTGDTNSNGGLIAADCCGFFRSIKMDWVEIVAVIFLCHKE